MHNTYFYAMFTFNYSLLQEKEACKGGKAYHANGIDTQDKSAVEGGNKEGYANAELPHTGAWRTEVLRVAQQESSSSKETNDNRA